MRSTIKGIWQELAKILFLVPMLMCVVIAKAGELVNWYSVFDWLDPPMEWMIRQTGLKHTSTSTANPNMGMTKKMCLGCGSEDGKHPGWCFSRKMVEVPIDQKGRTGKSG